MYSLVDKIKRVCFKTKRVLHASIYIKCSGGIEEPLDESEKGK